MTKKIKIHYRVSKWLFMLCFLITANTTPSRLSGQVYYYDDECAEDDCRLSSGIIFAGAASVAAVAGVIAGVVAGKNNHGHSGSKGLTGATGTTGATGDMGLQGNAGPIGPTGLPGATGPTGASGATGEFPQDLNAILTFDFSINVTQGIGATITPFVVAPDGTMTISPTIVLTALNLGSFNPQIVINNPEFGDYDVGFSIKTAGVGLNSTIGLNVVASRNASTTLLVSPTTFNVALGSETQTQINFAYGPAVTGVP